MLIIKHSKKNSFRNFVVASGSCYMKSKTRLTHPAEMVGRNKISKPLPHLLPASARWFHSKKAMQFEVNVH